MGDREGDEDNTRSLREASRVGYHLSQSHGYRVISQDGRALGVIERLRYERHAEYPEEIVIRSGRLFWKRIRPIPFDAVASVDTRQRLVRLR